MCSIHCALSTTQHSGEYEGQRTHIATGDMHGRMELFMHWKHVDLDVWGLLKFELRMLVMD